MGNFRLTPLIGREMIYFVEFTINLITNEELLKMYMNSRHSHQIWRHKVNGIEYVLCTASSATDNILIFSI